MSLDASAIDPEPILTSNEPSTDLIQALQATFIGTFKMLLHPNLFSHAASLELGTHCQRRGIAQQRECTESDVKRIRDSLFSHESSVSNFPLVAAVAPDPWRLRAREGTQEALLLESNRVVENFKAMKPGQVVGVEGAEDNMLVLLDGQARLKILLENYESSNPFYVYVQLYDSGVFEKERKSLLIELVHGSNVRQAFAANAAQPTLFTQIRAIYSIRTGDKLARLNGQVDKDIASSFFGYTSSRTRLRFAGIALADKVFQHFVEVESKSRVNRLFSQFGAASPLIFHSLTDTLKTFRLLDPSQQLLSPTFYFYFSLLVNLEKFENPLAAPESSEEEPTRRESCTILAGGLRIILDRLQPHGKVELQCFTELLGKAVPPWMEGSPTLELAREVVEGFEKLVSILDDGSLYDGHGEEFSRKFCTYRDLISTNPDTKGTEMTRSIALLESHFLTPLAEIWAACVQLSRDDDSLKLPSQYYQTFQDPEPFYIELALPGQGIDMIKMGRRKVKNTAPWAEPSSLDLNYTNFLKALWIAHPQILQIVLAAKARLASLSPLQRSQLLNIVLDSTWEDTPQAEVIQQHLHLAFLAIRSDRSLAPGIFPPEFARCNAWLHADMDSAFFELAETDSDDVEPSLFEAAYEAISSLPRHSLNNEYDREIAVIYTDLVTNNVDEVNLKDLPNTIDELIDSIDEFETPTLLDVASTQDPDNSDGSGDPNEREWSGEKDTSILANEARGRKRSRSEEGECVEGGESDEEGSKRDDAEPEEEPVVTQSEQKGGSGEDVTMADQAGARDIQDDSPPPKPPKLPKPSKPPKPSDNQPKKKRKKKKIKATASERDYIPAATRSRRQRQSSNSPPQTANRDPSSTLVLSVDHLFPTPNASPSKSKSNLTSWSNTRSLVDPRVLAVEAKGILSNAASLAVEILSRFRQSNCYPPLGHSYDAGSFQIDNFTSALSTFIYSTDEPSPDELDQQQDEASNGKETFPDGLTSTRITLRITDMILEVCQRGERDGVYEYWQGVEEEMKEAEEE